MADRPSRFFMDADSVGEGSRLNELRQDILQHVAMHIRQPEIAALMAVRQAGMLQAQEVQDGRLEVVRVNGVAADVETELVGTAVGHAGLEAAARGKEGEREGVMVAS